MKALIQFKDGTSFFSDVPFGCRGSYATVLRAGNCTAYRGIGSAFTGDMPDEHVTVWWKRAERNAHGHILHDVFEER